MTEDLVRKFVMRRSRSFVTLAGRGVFFCVICFSCCSHSFIYKIVFLTIATHRTVFPKRNTGSCLVPDRV